MATVIQWIISKTTATITTITIIVVTYSSGNKKYSNNKNRNERSLMDHNSNSNHSNTGGDGKKLDIKDANAVLSLLNSKPDKLRDSSQDYRPVYLCIQPGLCHRTNTSLMLNSRQKLRYCTWCHQLRRGNQKQDSICLNCGECLMAKYHQWYPELVRLQLLEKQRAPELYCQYKQTSEKYGITWDDEKELQFAMSHCMLSKLWVSNLNFAVDERSYMIGVFAGHEFITCALARKLLLAAVTEQMNARYFQGICYFLAHHTNFDGWYDQQTLTREHIIETFKYLCDEILRHTVTKDSNGAPKTVNMPTQIDTNQSFVQLIAASSATRGNFNSGASPLRTLPIIGTKGITNGVSSINIINTLTSTNASSLNVKVKQTESRSSKKGKSSSRKDNENKMATKIRQEFNKLKCFGTADIFLALKVYHTYLKGI